jgi:hypothetical protein
MPCLSRVAPVQRIPLRYKIVNSSVHGASQHPASPAGEIAVDVVATTLCHPWASVVSRLSARFQRDRVHSRVSASIWEGGAAKFQVAGDSDVFDAIKAEAPAGGMAD